MVLKFRKDLMQMKIKEKINTNHQQNKCLSSINLLHINYRGIGKVFAKP